MSVKVCHFSSAHPRYDVRIFMKECRSLAAAGYDISLVVADGKGDETNSGVKIIDAGQTGGRLSRMTKGVWAVYKKALLVDADIYHFHDPELVFVAWLLLKKNKKVVYDVHEDLPRQLLGKHYLGKITASLISFAAEMVENFFARRFTAILTVTPFINQRFHQLNSHSEMMRNFPMLAEFESVSSDAKKEMEVCYVGSISAERGIITMIDAMATINGQLNLAGTFATGQLLTEAESFPGWKNVNFAGNISRSKMTEMLARSKAGLVFFKPLPNHVNAYPNKIFEYMAAGIPVVASDFPLWKEIVEGNNCGICVNPGDVNAIAGAVNSVLADEKMAQQMGENGKKAVKEKYNWEAESRNLLSFYEKLK